MLRLYLFGAPRIERDGLVVPLRRTKALALLAYLAMAGQPQDRERLIALLWPEFDEASARNNLRRELSLLKTMLDEELVVADRLQLAWNQQAHFWLDVHIFQQQRMLATQHGHTQGALCAECAAALQAAIQLYTDDLMAGFSVPDSQAFDEWQFFQREELRQQLGEALQMLISWHCRRGEYSLALAYARRSLSLDPLDEPGQRELMRLYACSGQQAAALRQYEECVRLLDNELGVEPEAATRELYEQIRSRTFAKPLLPPEPQGVTEQAMPAPVPVAVPVVKYNLPQSDGFVGRQRELADIIRRLTDPACRLLTLTGPGGIGKTRLALQAAHILAQEAGSDEAFADGVLFVALAAVRTADGLLAALASAAQFELGSNGLMQLYDHFRTKRMLLVLDNFEQLLDQAECIGALLTAAPRLRLLVTSREALNIQEEWFHPINGLSIPCADDDISGVAQLAHFDAIRLFEQHARRVRSDFTLSRVREPVVRLCRLVDGIPLALELAASWLKVVPVEQVVTALERDLDILTTRDRNIPERHRSMRVVLNESWAQLSPEQQHILAGMAVFVGGCTAEAAEAVAGASLPVLATLVEKSLVRSGSDGRFLLHELLRQYLEERLCASPEAEQQAYARHTEFFCAMAEQGEEELQGAQQLAWVERLSADQDNLRAVLRRLHTAGDTARLLRLGVALSHFWFIRGYRTEGRAWLQCGLDLLAATPTAQVPASLHGQALRGAGKLAFTQDDFAAAEVYHQASLEAFERAGDITGIEIALNNLGLAALYRSNLPAARSYLERSLVLAPQSGSEWNYAASTHNLAIVLSKQGDMASARPLFEESLALSRSAGDIFGILVSLVDYGNALAQYGDYAAASTLAEEALCLSRESNNIQLTSDALGILGLIALLRGQNRQACSIFEQVLAFNRTIDEGKSLPVDTLVYQGIALIREGDLAKAREQLRTALIIARSMPQHAQLQMVLWGMACLAASCGDYERAAQLFGTSEAYLRAQGQALLPAEHTLILPSVLLVRTALGQRASALAWAEGQRLAQEAACALAHQVILPEESTDAPYTLWEPALVQRRIAAA